MRIEFDSGKNGINVATRQLSCEQVVGFDFDTARIWQDTRMVYSEVRMVAVGYLDRRLHVLCFTPTADGIRVISFRKANQREGTQHGFALTRDS